MTKRSWQYIKAKRRDQTEVSTLKTNNKEITDSKQKAEILCSHFRTVFTDEDLVLPSMPPSEIPDMPNITIAMEL